MQMTLTMEIVSILLIVVSGTAFSSGIGRVAFGWGYDVVLVATSVVIFGVGGLSLIVFSKLGVVGIILTLVTAVLLTFVFVRFNVNDAVSADKGRRVLGCIYWGTLLIVFAIAGLKSWDISVCINLIFSNQTYSLENNWNFFYFTFCLFAAIGCLSILMFIRECKQAVP